MVIEPKHRILLVNFTAQEAAHLTKAGFNCELGYIGKSEKRNGEKHLPYSFPHPPYEYEIYVYNSKIPLQEVEKFFPSPKNLLAEEKMADTLRDLGKLGIMRIAFIGVSAGLSQLILGGLPSIHLQEAHEGVSALETVRPGRSFAIPELEDAIKKLRKDMILPVGQYLTWGKKDTYPVYHLPVVMNRRDDEVASYGTIYSNRTIPLYIVLPQLRSNVAGLLELLNVLIKVRPELFPDIKTRAWYESNEFALGEVKAIDDEIDLRVKKMEEFIEAKREEKNAIVERLRFIKEILIATEDLNTEASHRLSANVRKVLEFLGFAVEDIDEKIKGAIKKEDFWVRHGDFLAITEVTGTVSKNPKITEVNGILGRMTTIFKRQDLVPNTKNISGLLVVNHDIDTHPMRRPRLYAGELEEIVEGAKEQGVGLLSTVELYKIAVAVKDGLLSADEARKIIKQPGRIEFGGGMESSGG